MHRVLFAIVTFWLASTVLTTIAAEPKRVAWQSGFVGSPEPPLPLVLEPAFPKLSFQGPISINRLPESNRYLVLEQHHKIFSFVDHVETSAADLFVDFAVQKPLCGGLPDREQRNIDLFSIAFHPHFATNRLAYVCYVSSGKETKTHIMLRSGSIRTSAAAGEHRIRHPHL